VKIILENECSRLIILNESQELSCLHERPTAMIHLRFSTDKYTCTDAHNPTKYRFTPGMPKISKIVKS
jgi:hypothetical protein